MRLTNLECDFNPKLCMHRHQKILFVNLRRTFVATILVKKSEKSKLTRIDLFMSCFLEHASSFDVTIIVLFAYRVCYTFGKRIKFQIQDITSTFLSIGVISTARQADHVAHSVLRNHG